MTLAPRVGIGPGSASPERGGAPAQQEREYGSVSDATARAGGRNDSGHSLRNRHQPLQWGPPSPQRICPGCLPGGAGSRRRLHGRLPGAPERPSNPPWRLGSFAPGSQWPARRPAAPGRRPDPRRRSDQAHAALRVIDPDRSQRPGARVIAAPGFLERGVRGVFRWMLDGGRASYLGAPAWPLILTARRIAGKRSRERIRSAGRRARSGRGAPARRACRCGPRSACRVPPCSRSPAGRSLARTCRRTRRSARTWTCHDLSAPVRLPRGRSGSQPHPPRT
jgi:hypothetical protein